MILGYNEIKAALDSGVWTCHRDGVKVGSDELTINPNSVNVTLGDKLLKNIAANPIDMHSPKTAQWAAGEFEELCVCPGDFYLMHVRERFNCDAPLLIHGRECYFAPMIEGRSSVARCGLSLHDCGFGDYSFSGNFTLEVTAAMPVIVRPGDEVAQIQFVEVSSPTKYNSVYSDQYDEPRAPVLGRGRFQRNKELEGEL